MALLGTPYIYEISSQLAGKVFTHKCDTGNLSAANRKETVSALPNVGPYIYDVSIYGFTRSSIYIYDISRLRVKQNLISGTVLQMLIACR